MSGLDFRRPELCPAVPLLPWLKASCLIALQQALPMKWSLRLSLLGRHIETWTNPRRRDQIATVLKALQPEGREYAHLRRHIRLSLLARRLGARTYAVVFRRSPEWLLRTFQPEGLDALEQVRKDGKGAIILATHAGMHVWMPAVLTQLGFPMRLIQRKKVYAQTLVLLRRDGWVPRVLPFPEPSEAGIHLKRLYDLLQKGEWIQHVADYPDLENGVKGKFFGVEVSCRRAPWVLARLSGAPLIPVLVLLEEDLSARLIVGPRLHVETEPPELEAMNSAFQRYLDFVEACVRPRPWNLYIHLSLSRTKTGPGREAAGGR